MGTEGAGLDAAFRDEVLPHLDAVYRFALRLAGSPDLAQDLVQDTFLRAYRARDPYEPGGVLRLDRGREDPGDHRRPARGVPHRVVLSDLEGRRLRTRGGLMIFDAIRRSMGRGPGDPNGGNGDAQRPD